VKHPDCPVKVPHRSHTFRSTDEQKPADFPRCNGTSTALEHTAFTALESAALQMYYAMYMTVDIDWMAKMPDSVAQAYTRLGGVIDG
jgi:hypothetical protein